MSIERIYDSPAVLKRCINCYLISSCKEARIIVEGVANKRAETVEHRQQLFNVLLRILQLTHLVSKVFYL